MDPNHIQGRGIYVNQITDGTISGNIVYGHNQHGNNTGLIIGGCSPDVTRNIVYDNSTGISVGGEGNIANPLDLPKQDFMITALASE